MSLDVQSIIILDNNFACKFGSFLDYLLCFLTAGAVLSLSQKFREFG